jgi:hypothetical protein
MPECQLFLSTNMVQFTPELVVHFGPELLVHFTPELLVHYSPDYTLSRNYCSPFSRNHCTFDSCLQEEELMLQLCTRCLDAVLL